MKPKETKGNRFKVLCDILCFVWTMLQYISSIFSWLNWYGFLDTLKIVFFTFPGFELQPPFLVMFILVIFISIISPRKGMGSLITSQKQNLKWVRLKHVACLRVKSQTQFWSSWSELHFKIFIIANIIFWSNVASHFHFRLRLQFRCCRKHYVFSPNLQLILFDLPLVLFKQLHPPAPFPGSPPKIPSLRRLHHPLRPLRGTFAQLPAASRGGAGTDAGAMHLLPPAQRVQGGDWGRLGLVVLGLGLEPTLQNGMHWQTYWHNFTVPTKTVTGFLCWGYIQK